jgi:hypothetical protein
VAGLVVLAVVLLRQANAPAPEAPAARVALPLGGASAPAVPAALLVAGSCEDPGEVVFDLDGGLGGSGGMRSGSVPATALVFAVTDVEARLRDFTTQPHAVIVPPPADAADQGLVCGDIGGYIDDDALPIGLRSGANGDLAGMAILWELEETVEIEIYLAEEFAAAPATPIAAR